MTTTSRFNEFSMISSLGTTSVISETVTQVSQKCDMLDSSWTCSNKRENHSLCIKFCNDDSSEYKRCVCKNSACFWSLKGKKCFDNSDQSGFSSSIDKYDLQSLNSLMRQINIANNGHIHVQFQL